MVARRALVALALAACVAAPAGLAWGQTAHETSLRSLDLGVLRALNAIRREHGLVPLSLDPRLTAAARAHSEQMLADGYFSHDSRDGAPFWKRLTAYEDAGPPRPWSVGENLLWSSPGVGAAKALELWMASPEHRKNILTAGWRQIGVAAMHVDSAPGTYGGRAVTVITTDFGDRGQRAWQDSNLRPAA